MKLHFFIDAGFIVLLTIVLIIVYQFDILLKPYMVFFSILVSYFLGRYASRLLNRKSECSQDGEGMNY